MKASLLVAILTAMNAAVAAPQDVGIVLLHGKGGTPEGVIGRLAVELGSKGYRVSTPVMPWSTRRIYDRTFEEALKEIDAEFDALRANGAKTLVIAGQSLGANVALGYAAARPSIGGAIVLAPGHNPESAGFRRALEDDVKRARALVASGKGAEPQLFGDRNMGKSYTVSATPQVYLSWMDPDGAAVMPKSAAAINQPVPLLFVIGSRDRNAQPKAYAFDKAPAHPKSKYLTVPADHLEVPSAAAAEVIAWLASLGG